MYKKGLRERSKDLNPHDLSEEVIMHLSSKLIGEIDGSPFDMPHVLQEKQSIASAIDYVLEHPNIRDFAVVDEQSRVTGFLPMRKLGKYTFTRIFPRLSTEVNIRHILPPSTIRTIALAPVTVRFEATIYDALWIMLTSVSSEVHIVDADNVLMGAFRVEQVFSILTDKGIIKTL